MGRKGERIKHIKGKRGYLSNIRLIKTVRTLTIVSNQPNTG